VILSIIEAFHNCGFIHRDIKPNNIMVENNGMVKLIDMGSVKIINKEIHKNYLLKDSSSVTNLDGISTLRNEAMSLEGNTFVGTEGYISPEMLLNDEVGTECDIWAFGCIAFRLMTGQEAFVNESMDQMQVFDNIKKEKYSLTEIDDDEAKNLISNILKQNVRERLTIDQIKHHSYFVGTAWESLLLDNYMVFQEDD